MTTIKTKVSLEAKSSLVDWSYDEKDQLKPFEIFVKVYIVVFVTLTSI